MGQHLKLMIVTAMGMVFGASLFGLYRFVGADSPKSTEDAGWVAPGVARSGPTVTVEKSSPGSPPVVVPSLPPVPTQRPLDVPSVRHLDLVPAAWEIPVIPTPPTPAVAAPSPEVPAVPVDIKPPSPSDLPSDKPLSPAPLPIPKPSISPPPAGPSLPSTTPTAPPGPRISEPTELGPFKLASNELAPAPRVQKSSNLAKPTNSATVTPAVPAIPAINSPGPGPGPSSGPGTGPSSGPSLPMGPTAPLPPNSSRIETPAKPVVPSLPPPVLPEKPLQPALPSNTLNPSGATPSTPTPVLPVPDVATTKPGPFLPEPMPTPTIPGVNYPAPMLPTPGVEPMPLPSRQLMMSTTLGVALALTPATTPIQAQAPSTPPPLSLSPANEEGKAKELPKAVLDDETKKLLEELKKDVATIKAAQKDFQSLILGKENSTNLADMGILKRLSELESRVAKLDESLKKLDAAMKDATNRIVAAYPGTSGGSATPPAAPMSPSSSPPATTPANPAPSSTKAYIRIVNDYPAEMSILINDGKSYRVPSGTAQLVEVPPGSYKYELLHTGSQPKTGTIKEGETITLRIN